MKILLFGKNGQVGWGRNRILLLQKKIIEWHDAMELCIDEVLESQ